MLAMDVGERCTACCRPLLLACRWGVSLLPLSPCHKRHPSILSPLSSSFPARVLCCAQVNLQRQMDRGVREFAEFRRQRDHELLQLKKQGRHNAAQLQRLEALHSKQQAVLRRKTGGGRAPGLAERGRAAWLGPICWFACERDRRRTARTRSAYCLACLTAPAPAPLCLGAEEAEAARKRLKQMEDRQKLACRPATSAGAAAAAAPAAERPFTAPAAAGSGAAAPGRPPMVSGGTAERSTASTSASAPDSECQPNPMVRRQLRRWPDPAASGASCLRLNVFDRFAGAGAGRSCPALLAPCRLAGRNCGRERGVPQCGS